MAIKVLPDRFSDDNGRRAWFEREARLLARLNHPHICVLHDVGSDNGAQFLVMEYLEGETLAARLQHGALRTGQALRYAAQIADALDKAHRQGIIHRDLKPGNIMIEKSGNLKLLDFGLAKALASHASDTTLTLADSAPGAVKGTVPYMSPEQLQGQEGDARSDIFAFGAVLYEMLTGRRAFAGDSAASVIASVIGQEPPPSHPSTILDSTTWSASALRRIPNSAGNRPPIFGMNCFGWLTKSRVLPRRLETDVCSGPG